MRRAATLLLLVGASFFALDPAADAHALLNSSVPAAGAQLERAPDAVTIVFTETPEPSLSTIHVLDTSGTSYEKGRPQPVAADAHALLESLRPLPQGVFTVAWRTVSRTDGHATAGSFAFGVGVPATVAPGGGGGPKVSSPPPSGLEIAGRFGLFLGLMGIVGGGWVAAGAFGIPPKTVLRLASWAWGIGLAGLVSLAEAQRRAAGAGLGDLLSTPLGHSLIWRAAALVAAGGALLGVALSTGGARRRWIWVAVAAGAGLAYAHVAAGHAEAASPRTAEVLAQWVHVVTASAWIGGLAALLVGLRGEQAEDKAASVHRFSTVAGFLLATVAATGIVRAFGQLHRWSDLWDTSYGLVVLAKAGLILVLAALGATNRYRNVPRRRETLAGLRRISRVEVGVGVVTLAAAALLAGLAPPPPSASAAAPAGIVVPGSDLGTTTRVRLSVVPGTAGPNRFEVRITDFDSGAPITDAKVSLRFTYLDDSRVGQSTLALARDGDVYRGQGLTLSLAGRWRVVVLIERGTRSLEVELQLATRCDTRAIGGTPTIYIVDITGGGTAQGYVDPQRAGATEVHITFFDTAGKELPVQGSVTMRGSSGDRLIELVARKLSPGHFVADSTLAPGTWRFDFSATSMGGLALRGCFAETLRP